MQQDIRAGWEGNVPNIHAIAQPYPGAPHMPLTGGCSASTTLDKFLRDLERGEGSSHYREYIWGYHGSEDEADIYELTCWDVCRPDNGLYEAVVILYYSPINHLATLKKHMPEFVDEYLEEQAQIEALEQLVEEAA